MKSIGSLGCGGVLAASLAFSTTALAQAAPDDSNAGEVSILEEITVTAQKRPELLSKTPLAVSAISGQALASAGVISPLTLGDTVPSAQIFQANGIQIAIRGVTSPDGTEKGDPSAAFMVDGIYMARQQAISPAFFDLDRVEVLRGPQGTLYGRNATAGVVNVISKRPEDELAAYVHGELGNYNTQRLEGMINIPVSDTFAMRASGAFNKHDSFLENAPGDTHELGFDQDTYAGRLSALWNFAEDRKGSLLLIADYAHEGGSGPMPVRSQDFFTNHTTIDPVYFDASSKDRRTVRYPFASNQDQNNKSYGLTTEFNYDLGPFAVTYVGGYKVFDRYNLEVLSFPNRNRFPDTWATGKTTSKSHELRFSKEIPDVLDAVLGVYYFQEDTPNSNTILKDYAGIPWFGFLYSDVFAESKAVFGQATYHVTDALRLTAGARYSKDHKSREGLTVSQSTPSAWIDPSLYTITGVNDADVTFSKTTWKVGADYDVTDKLLAYVSVATGYKAGGFNDGCSAGSPSCTAPTADNRLYYQPENLIAYEAGVKGNYFDRTLSLNLTGFYYDYKDLQLNSQQEPPAPPGQLTLNAGKARVVGAEIESVMLPTTTDRIDFSIALLKAEYVDYRPLLTIDYHGRPLDYSPKTVANLGYTHTFPLGNGGEIRAHADTRYSSGYVATDFNIPAQFEQPSYWLSNATVSYHSPSDRWYTEAFVKNIGDEITFSGYGSSGRIFVSEPRLYGLRAGINF